MRRFVSCAYAQIPTTCLFPTQRKFIGYSLFRTSELALELTRNIGQPPWGGLQAVLEMALTSQTGLDGKNPTQLLADSTAFMLTPSACGAGYVVFPWAFHGGTNSANIWRVNADGSSPLKLTNGEFDHKSVCSPDQKWVYYTDQAAGRIGRVPLDGSGKPEAVPGSADFHGLIAGVDMSISADGKTLAYGVEVVNAETQQRTAKVALLNLDAPTSPRLLDANPHWTGGVQFTPDGNAVAYPIREKGVDNLWVQPLDGSAGQQMTNFNSEQIGSFHWSPDRKSLGTLRGHSESDVVLLQESKP